MLYGCIIIVCDVAAFPLCHICDQGAFVMTSNHDWEEKGLNGNHDLIWPDLGTYLAFQRENQITT